MKNKMKFKEVLEIRNFLESLIVDRENQVERDYSAPVKYFFIRNIVHIDKEIELFEGIRGNLVHKYGEPAKDEEGKDCFRTKEEDKEKFFSEIQELIDFEIELECFKASQDFQNKILEEITGFDISLNPEVVNYLNKYYFVH